MMADIINPPFGTRHEEDPFLSPSGQPDSLVDALAAAQHRTIERSIVVEIVDRDFRIAVIVTEVRHV